MPDKAGKTCITILHCARHHYSHCRRSSASVAWRARASRSRSPARLARPARSAWVRKGLILPLQSENLVPETGRVFARQLFGSGGLSTAVAAPWPREARSIAGFRPDGWPTIEMCGIHWTVWCTAQSGAIRSLYIYTCFCLFSVAKQVFWIRMSKKMQVIPAFQGDIAVLQFRV